MLSSVTQRQLLRWPRLAHLWVGKRGCKHLAASWALMSDSVRAQHCQNSQPGWIKTGWVTEHQAFSFQSPWLAFYNCLALSLATCWGIPLLEKNCEVCQTRADFRICSVVENCCASCGSSRASSKHAASPPKVRWAAWEAPALPCPCLSLLTLRGAGLHHSADLQVTACTSSYTVTIRVE